MFWISPDATKGDRLNIGVGNRYEDKYTRLSIVSNGYVGIGTTSPRAKLDVAGTIHSSKILVDGTSYLSKIIKIGQASADKK
jgi:hypothetical protein